MTPLHFSAILLALGITGCSLNNSDKTAPTAFLTSTGSDLSASMSRLPFDHAWKDPSLDLTKYTHIAIRPATSGYLDSDSWTASESEWILTREAYQTQAANLTKYWTRSLKKQFSSPICSFYITDDTSRPSTVILEAAIVRTSFGRPADPARKTSATNPMVAVELRFKDSLTGRILATASDQYEHPFKLQDFTKESFARPNEIICDEWSRQLMQASNKEIFPKVRR
jgi:hypothetical protein